MQRRKAFCLSTKRWGAKSVALKNHHLVQGPRAKGTRWNSDLERCRCRCRAGQESGGQAGCKGEGARGEARRVCSSRNAREMLACIPVRLPSSMRRFRDHAESNASPTLSATMLSGAWGVSSSCCASFVLFRFFQVGWPYSSWFQDR